MSRPLPIALVQYAAPRDRVIETFSERLRALRRVYSETRLFLYPEHHLSPVENFASEAEAAAACAEPIDGPRDAALASLAAELDIWLVPGSFFELGEDGRVYNTTAVYSPRGERVAAYRKIFPWRPHETLAAGSEFKVFDMPGVGRIGLSICYDAWFPESARHLAWMGAELILNVVKTPTGDRAQETVLARANAIANQVFVASVNAAAPDGIGRSLLVDPQGTVRQGTEDTGELVLGDVIDLDEVANVRRYGTAGVTRPWRQFDNVDTALDLPLYGGTLDPARWRRD